MVSDTKYCTGKRSVTVRKVSSVIITSLYYILLLFLMILKTVLGIGCFAVSDWVYIINPTLHE